MKSHICGIISSRAQICWELDQEFLISQFNLNFNNSFLLEMKMKMSQNKWQCGNHVLLPPQGCLQTFKGSTNFLFFHSAQKHQVTFNIAISTKMIHKFEWLYDPWCQEYNTCVILPCWEHTLFCWWIKSLPNAWKVNCTMVLISLVVHCLFYWVPWKSIVTGKTSLWDKRTPEWKGSKFLHVVLLTATK